MTNYYTTRYVGKRRLSTTGEVGVSLTTSGNYVAELRYDRKRHRIGTYATLDEAVAARKAAEHKYWGLAHAS